MNQKEIKKLQKRADEIEKAVKKECPKWVWEAIVELIEIELELEANSNK